MATNICIIISLLLTLIYTSAAVFRTGEIPESLSATSYMWEADCDHRPTHRAYIFTTFCVIEGALIFYPWLNATTGGWRFLCYAGCVALMVAGATPFFHEKPAAYVHYGAGIVAALSVIAWMAFMHQWVFFILMPLEVWLGVRLWGKDKWVFVLEMVLLVMIPCSLW